MVEPGEPSTFRRMVGDLPKRGVALVLFVVLVNLGVMTWWRCRTVYLGRRADASRKGFLWAGHPPYWIPPSKWTANEWWETVWSPPWKWTADGETVWPWWWDTVWPWK